MAEAAEAVSQVTMVLQMETLRLHQMVLPLVQITKVAVVVVHKQQVVKVVNGQTQEVTKVNLVVH
jgi:hypothetical protein